MKNHPHHKLATSGQPQQALERCSEVEHIRMCLRAIVLTQRGERNCDPSLGSTVRDFIFRPLVSTLKNEIALSLRNEISVAEPRVEISEIDINQDPLQPTRVLLSLRYRIPHLKKSDGIQFALN